MKNTIKILGIIALAAVIGFTVVSCSGGGGGGKISGTYVDEDGEASFTFSGSKLTTEMWGQKGEGTFQVKDGKLILTSKEGKTETWDYKLDGNKLTLNMMGLEFDLFKK